MAPLIPRFHLFEINDQSWFPDFLRQRVQASLTLMWTLRIPGLQPCSPASLVTQTLLQVLGDRSSEYTYVDFCAGAGGPTLAIEREFNARLAGVHSSSTSSDQKFLDGSDASSTSGEDSAIPTPQSSPSGSSTTLTSRRSKRSSLQSGDDHHHDTTPAQAYFILTDIAPHLSAWSQASRQSQNLRYVPQSIDASAAPANLISLAAPASLPRTSANRPIFRLFSLAFHHFDDPLATAILTNTLSTSSGFVILELQQRNIMSIIMTLLLFPLTLLVTPVFFWNDPVHLLFTYLIPIIPLVVALDGIVSSLRTRTGEEVNHMVQHLLKERQGSASASAAGDWDVLWGSEWHTWPLGEMSWVIGLKKEEKE